MDRPMRNIARLRRVIPGAMSEAVVKPDESEIMTVEEGAAFLRVGRNALYDAIGRGDVPHRRIGKSIRLSRSALVAWLGSR